MEFKQKQNKKRDGDEIWSLNRSCNSGKANQAKAKNFEFEVVAVLGLWLACLSLKDEAFEVEQEANKANNKV